MNKSIKKIMIFGRPGSGKSTFALALHQMTDLPLHHLDKHFFKSNWVERNYEEFLSVQQSMVDSQHWIIDGNNTKSLEMRYSNADLVIYFNYPRWKCYWRVFKRLLNKNRELNDCAEGCVGFRLNLIPYMWIFEKRVSQKINDLKQKYREIQFVEINTDKELKKLKEKLLS